MATCWVIAVSATLLSLLGQWLRLLTITLFRGGEVGGWVIFSFLFASTLSHGLVDMLTNGGLGVALLAPFDNGRYFFPFRPIEVSPLGIANFLPTWARSYDERT